MGLLVISLVIVTVILVLNRHEIKSTALLVKSTAVSLLAKVRTLTGL